MIHLAAVWPCRDSASHLLDVNVRACRRCFLTFEAIDALNQIDARVHARRAATCVPSDLGLDGAIPLESASQPWAPLDDADWAAQNRKINDLLMGRAG